MGYTFAEKILSKKSRKKIVTSGEIITIEPDILLTDEAAASVIELFKEIGAKKLVHPERIFITLDHCSPPSTINQAEKQLKVREFVELNLIKEFYDIGEGLSHQLVAESGMVHPGQIIVGSDSHTITNGAFGTFSIGISRAEMAGLYATGEIWLKVPESIKIFVEGNFGKGIMAKDLALQILGDVDENGALYCCVEFDGPGLKYLDMDERRTLTNTMVEAGAKTAFIPPDEITINWLKKYTNISLNYDDFVFPDKNASYKKKLYYDMQNILPNIAIPDSPAAVRKISEISEVLINQTFIGTCTGGRLRDIEIAAKILKNKHIAKLTRLLVCPNSKKILNESIEFGYISILLNAGAIILPPGCGPCAGIHQGTIAKDEVCISSGIRNYKGRMGSGESKIFISSPATVAASAIVGKIADPRQYFS